MPYAKQVRKKCCTESWMGFKSAHYRMPRGADSLREFLVMLEFGSIGNTDAVFLNHAFHLSTQEEL